MKKKKILKHIIIAVSVLSAIMAGMFAVMPDKVVYCEQLCKYKLGSFQLKEASEDELDLKTADAESMKISGELMLVNRAHPLPTDYVPALDEYKNSGVIMSAFSVDSYAELSKDISDHTGEKLYVMSSYRDASEQQEIFEAEGSSTAMPALCSEHETGLAQDLYFQSYSGSAINKCSAGRYLTSHAAEHGFILRYPPMSEEVTGVGYEPWHFRYVGAPHAEIITENGITLEEYIDGLEYGKFYVYGEYIISRQNGNTLTIPDGYRISVSADNCGGHIITDKR